MGSVWEAVTLPGGDPDPASWAVALLDLLAAGVCLMIAFGRGVLDRRGRVFWLLLAVIALALGVNRQADPQRVLLPWVGRTLEEQSLGGYRWLATVAGAAAVAVAAIAVLGALWWLARPRRFRLALAGTSVLLVFAVVRTAALGNLLLAGRTLPSHSAALVLEGAGAVLVLVAAVDELLRGRRTPAVP